MVYAARDKSNIAEDYKDLDTIYTVFEEHTRNDYNLYIETWSKK